MREELEEFYFQEEKIFSKKRLVAIFWSALLSLLLCYFAILLWGNNSLEVYQALKEEKAQIQKEVFELENKNVELQKIIFELKGLEPSKEENS